MCVTVYQMTAWYPPSFLVHTVECFWNWRWFNCEYEQVLCICWQRSMKHLSENMQLPGSCFTEKCKALVRWGGKIKHILTAYFLSKGFFAKNYRNQFMNVEVTASQRLYIFGYSVVLMSLIISFKAILKLQVKITESLPSNISNNQAVTNSKNEV